MLADETFVRRCADPRLRDSLQAASVVDPFMILPSDHDCTTIMWTSAMIRLLSRESVDLDAVVEHTTLTWDDVSDRLCLYLRHEPGSPRYATLVAPQMLMQSLLPRNSLWLSHLPALKFLGLLNMMQQVQTAAPGATVLPHGLELAAGHRLAVMMSTPPATIEGHLTWMDMGAMGMLAVDTTVDDVLIDRVDFAMRPLGQAELQRRMATIMNMLQGGRVVVMPNESPTADVYAYLPSAKALVGVGCGRVLNARSKVFTDAAKFVGNLVCSNLDVEQVWHVGLYVCMEPANDVLANNAPSGVQVCTLKVHAEADGAVVNVIPDSQDRAHAPSRWFSAGLQKHLSEFWRAQQTAGAADVPSQRMMTSEHGITVGVSRLAGCDSRLLLIFVLQVHFVTLSETSAAQLLGDSVYIALQRAEA